MSIRRFEGSWLFALSLTCGCAVPTEDDPRSARPGGDGSAAAAGTAGTGGDGSAAAAGTAGTGATTGDSGTGAGNTSGSGGSGTGATASTGSGGSEPSGGTGGTGDPGPAGGASSTGGAAAVACACPAGANPASGADCSATNSLDFEAGTHGAYTLFTGITSSLSVCSGESYCGSASLMACADFIATQTGDPQEEWWSTRVADILVPLPTGVTWPGKTVKGRFMLSGSFIPEMQFDFRFHSEDHTLETTHYRPGNGEWVTLSGVVPDAAADKAPQVAFVFRPKGTWQGTIFVDQVSWE